MGTCTVTVTTIVRVNMPLISDNSLLKLALLVIFSMLQIAMGYYMAMAYAKLQEQKKKDLMAAGSRASRDIENEEFLRQKKCSYQSVMIRKWAQLFCLLRESNSVFHKESLYFLFILNIQMTHMNFCWLRHFCKKLYL